jgi:hypothetical protein
MADVTPDLIFQVANGFMAAKHLFVANEVGLFEAAGGCSSDPGRRGTTHAYPTSYAPHPR